MAIANTPDRQSILRRIARFVEHGDRIPTIAETYAFGEVEGTHRAVTESGYVG